MKKNNNFIKLTLLNKWKKVVLILDSNIKVTFIRGIDRKVQLIL